MVLSKVTPLRNTFLVMAMIGFVFSVIYVAKYDLTWGVTFALVFFSMFIAAFIAMERAAPDEQLQMIPVIEKAVSKRKKGKRRK